MPSLVEIGLHVFVLKKILKNFVIVFTLFYYLPLEKGASLYLNKLKQGQASLKDALCQNWLKLFQWFLSSEDENV